MRAMLFFNKLLPVFVLPLGWVLLLLLYAIVRRKRWPVIVAASLLYVSSMPCVGATLIRSLESRFEPVAIAAMEKADAVVVLGGFLGPATAPGYLPNVNEAGERLEAGIVLHQNNKAEWLVFTGARLPWIAHAQVEGERSKRMAVDRGTAAERIIVTREVGNTVDELHAVAELIKERQWKSIILVTSAFHMPRAAMLFRNAGVGLTPFPVDYRVGPSSGWTLLDFVANAEGLRASECALREWYGIAFYALTGR